MFVVAHPDYARSVRIVPTGPESIELVVDWLLPAAHGEPSAEQLAHITGLARQVIQQDGDACELNQVGLHSRRFEHGVLVPQEHVLWEFHEWLRARLDAPGP
jgi:Rieske 2Fe-2S family protein